MGELVKKHQWKLIDNHLYEKLDRNRLYKLQTTGSTLVTIFNNLSELDELFYPHSIKRMFLTRFTDREDIEIDYKNTIRGDHAHYNTYELMIVLNGSVTVSLNNSVRISTYELEKNDILLIGPNVWRILTKFSKDNVNLFLCSTELNHDDYIRDFTEFQEYMQLNAH